MAVWKITGVFGQVSGFEWNIRDPSSGIELDIEIAGEDENLGFKVPLFKGSTCHNIDMGRRRLPSTSCRIMFRGLISMKMKYTYKELHHSLMLVRNLFNLNLQRIVVANLPLRASKKIHKP